MKSTNKYFLITLCFIVVCWYFFYFLTILINNKNSKQFLLGGYKDHTRGVEFLLRSYYSKHGFIPKKLERSLVANSPLPEEVLFCRNRVFKLRLSAPTFKNILLFLIFPLRNEWSQKKIKYSYVYNSFKNEYIVTLQYPFIHSGDFQNVTFKIAKGGDCSGKLRDTP